MGVLVDNAAKMKSQQAIAYFATLQLRNPDSMKGIRRGSTPPVGQKVRDSLLISQHVFDGVFREQIRTVRSLPQNGVQRGDNARPLNTLQVRGAVPFQAHNLKTQVRILHLHPKLNLTF